MPYKDKKLRNMSAKKRRQTLGLASPPEGFVPFQVTSDGDGNVTAVRSRPEGVDEPAFDLQHANQVVKAISTLLDGEGNVSQQWIKTDIPKTVQQELMLRALDAHMERYKGTSLPVWPNLDQAADDDVRVTILLGDPHIGMLSWHLETGEDFDLKIAESHMNAAVDLLVQRSPAAGSCVIANLGDFFHANDETALTPRGGNRLDIDSRFMHVTDIGYGMMRRVIDRARQKYRKVIVVNLPGNHDPAPARGLYKWLEAVYENCPEVEIVPNTNPYVFLEFGQNLTMFHHGDGCKVEQLPSVMAAYDKGRPWGRCEFREIQHGHYHHLRQKEHPGVVVEGSRTLAAQDYWHWHSGYRSGRGMRSVVHHKELGRLSEHVVGIKEVELVLQKAS